MRAKILVVDDEPDMTELLSFNLIKHGYEVLQAQTGLQALNLSRRHLPDLVLLDLKLNDLDGFTVCEILHSQLSTATIPVIAVTGLTGEIARVHAMNSGVCDFIRKPISIADVLHRVEKAIMATQCEASQREQDSVVAI
jgi:DNA-binding response OmpR family regulator